jgi:hypothetical protein
MRTIGACRPAEGGASSVDDLDHLIDARSVDVLHEGGQAIHALVLLGIGLAAPAVIVVQGHIEQAVSAVTELLTRPSDVTIYGISETVHPIADLSLEPQRAS